jgi:hypothetical protein
MILASMLDMILASMLDMILASMLDMTSSSRTAPVCRNSYFFTKESPTILKYNQCNHLIYIKYDRMEGNLGANSSHT